jgi:flavin-dependent dehydrogenase
MWDLLVLGGGPAGCAAALQARRDGLRVLLVETRTRSQVSPGETLHPGIEPVLERLGVDESVRAAGFPRHEGVWVTWDEARRYVPYGEDARGPWRGFQVDRRWFHELLLAACVEGGAVVRRGAAAEALLVDDGRVQGAVVNGREILARWTADATGRRAWLARELGIAERRCSPALRVRFGWTDGPSGRVGGAPSLAATCSGWKWRAPLGGGRMAWVALDVEGSAAARPSGMDATWVTRAALAGAGFFLLGDAGVALDPLSSHGVLLALMSGILCGHLVAATVRGLPAVEAVSLYGTWLQSQCDRDVARMVQLYRQHPARAVAERFGGSSGPE